jgi:hypothetical protein
MKIMPDWLLSALSNGDTPPTVSMSRLIAFLTILTVIVFPGLLYVELSALCGHLVEVPGSFTGYATAASAIALTMFAANKRAE